MENTIKDPIDIELWLRAHNISHFEIIDGFKVNVRQNVMLRNKNLRFIPICFNEVLQDFDVSSNNLKTLKNSPKKVGGCFDCSENKLENLKYVPESIYGYLDFSMNKIKTLKYFPKTIAGSIFGTNNEIESLEGISESLGKYIDLSYNNIESFKYGPKYIGGSFFITNNKIKSLEFAPEIIKESLVVNNNLITTTKTNIKEIKVLSLTHNLLETIEGLKNIKITEIVVSENEKLGHLQKITNPQELQISFNYEELKKIDINQNNNKTKKIRKY